MSDESSSEVTSDQRQGAFIHSRSTVYGPVVGANSGWINTAYQVTLFRGRAPRLALEPKVSGSVTCNNDVSYLLATAQLKNVGRSKVSLDPHVGATLSSFTYQATNSETARTLPDQIASIHRIFDKDTWIGPDETIEEQRLLAIPGCNHIAFRLELRIIAQIKYLGIFSKRVSWTVETIISRNSALADNKANQKQKKLDKVSAHLDLYAQLAGTYGAYTGYSEHHVRNSDGSWKKDAEGNLIIQRETKQLEKQDHSNIAKTLDQLQQMNNEIDDILHSIDSSGELSKQMQILYRKTVQIKCWIEQRDPEKVAADLENIRKQRQELRRAIEEKFEKV